MRSTKWPCYFSIFVTKKYVDLQGEPKNSTFAFFDEKFSKIFFQKSPIRGISMREIDCAHENTPYR
jgi:hypothetical protein